MTWRVEWDDKARKELRRLAGNIQKRILKFTGERLTGDEDPRRLGKALGPPFDKIWRYRVGDYRLLCRIEDNRLIVLVVSVANRRDVYR